MMYTNDRFDPDGASMNKRHFPQQLNIRNYTLNMSCNKPINNSVH